MDDTFDTDELLDTKQAAEYCGMTERCINIAVKEKRLALAPQSTSRKHLFYKSELQRFKATRQEHAKNKKAVKATVSLSELCVDPELEALIAPLTAAEFQQLTNSCSAEGIRDPIITWNGTIVDGHNRFLIAQKLGLKTVPVKAIPFETLDDAKLWIVHNQLGRRNVSKYERCRLALMLKDSVATDAEQRMLAGKSDPAQFSAQGSTRDILANLAGVSHDTLTKVEQLERDADDALKAKLRSGSISINKAWKTLQHKKIQSNKNKATPLDTSCVSADTDTYSEPTLPPVDNDTTPSVSAVVSSEPQAPVSAQPSNDELITTNLPAVTLGKEPVDYICSTLQEITSTIFQIISSTPFYGYNTDLEKDWNEACTIFIKAEQSEPFWRKFQKARAEHTLHKVVVIVPKTDTNFMTLLSDAILTFIIPDEETEYRIMMFDFTVDNQSS